MFNLKEIKGIIFDYGGTIDSNGKHWAEVLWESYQDNGVAVTKEQFREAYIFAERYLAANKVIMPDDNFLQLLQKKVELQINYLLDQKYLVQEDKTTNHSIDISTQCYNAVLNIIAKEKPILDQLRMRYPMVVVSNFYGDVGAVLKDFGLIEYFGTIVESAVVGIRKPDPAIFELGVKQLNLLPSEVVVSGDSYQKDIAPAAKIGCKTIWLKGIGWEKEEENASADINITDFMELKSIFELA